MKLLTKTTLFFLTIALFVLFVGGIVFYFSFRYMMNHEVKRELVTEMHQVILHPPRNNIIGIDSVVFDLPVHYQILPIKDIHYPKFIFSDTLLFDNIMGRYQTYRMLSYETSLVGKFVRITISKSLLVSDELVEYVAFVTLALSLILLLFIIGFNNYFFSRIWGNFFKTIDVIKDYSISGTEGITFTESEITEFNLLNQVFEKMHGRIKQDYQNLKEFIENVSHEIQNPLAIIKSRVDLLQQNENIDKSQAELIQSIQSSANRLSNLNKSLILLSKIDNNQFPEREEVDIVENINFHLENFEDIIQSKNISLAKNYRNPVVVWADSNLISIMLLNLLKNSIYHNVPSGTVEVIAEQNLLTIRNSGKNLDINQEDIFKRFTKSSNRPDSLGL
ncbi:MAG: HAMP domain-containing sensor histidine kinase, partial [Bacteroidales bacterium]|nr:HAMP domain-containing sensor histidine kinase [Bacteroidales bacterium]